MSEEFRNQCIREFVLRSDRAVNRENAAYEIILFIGIVQRRDR